MPSFIGMPGVWGTGNLSTSVIVISTSVASVQSYDFARTAQFVDLPDANGEPIGKAVVNAIKTLNISVIPLDGAGSPYSIADAKASLITLMAAPGATLTVADSDGTDTPIEITHSAKYYVLSSTVRRQQGAWAVVDLVCEQGPNDLSTTAGA